MTIGVHFTARPPQEPIALQNSSPIATDAHAVHAAHEPTRVVLFTDTLGDVNGVSRFIRTIAECARRQHVELHVITSTRFACPDAPNIHNIPPRYARPMPGYKTLDIVWPSAPKLVALARSLRPTAVHVSTPGPVGSVGRRFAIKNNLPLLGTYHTDFPAYIDHLFKLPPLTWMTRASMRRFYRPFSCVFTRSDDYAKSLYALGVEPSRVRRLLPGIDLSAFGADLRDASGEVWRSVPGARRESRKVLFVGRVSVEKNLPWLVEIWKRTLPRLRAQAIDAQLVIIGDGPYRERMEKELAAHDCVFAGFRHGQELARLYASSDLFVFPSTTDTLGQVVMEAQCAGVPVLVTDQGGPKEVVDDGVTGRVLGAGAGATDSWATAIVEILSDPLVQSSMGQAARRKMLPMSIEHSFQDFWAAHVQASRTPVTSTAPSPRS